MFDLLITTNNIKKAKEYLRSFGDILSISKKYNTIGLRIYQNNVEFLDNQDFIIDFIKIPLSRRIIDAEFSMIKAEEKLKEEPKESKVEEKLKEEPKESKVEEKLKEEPKESKVEEKLKEEPKEKEEEKETKCLTEN